MQVFLLFPGRAHGRNVRDGRLSQLRSAVGLNKAGPHHFVALVTFEVAVGCDRLRASVEARVVDPGEAWLRVGLTGDRVVLDCVHCGNVGDGQVGTDFQLLLRQLAGRRAGGGVAACRGCRRRGGKWRRGGRWWGRVEVASPWPTFRVRSALAFGAPLLTSHSDGHLLSGAILSVLLRCVRPVLVRDLRGCSASRVRPALPVALFLFGPLRGGEGKPRPARRGG